MLNCIVVDDEGRSRENLKVLLEEFCREVNVVGLCATTSEAANVLQKEAVDLVFLDVQMQRETGFDLFAKVEKRNFEVIFTTAYAEYAIKAFKFSALDYLLKPIDIEDLNQAVEKVRKQKSKPGVDLREQLAQLAGNLQPGGAQHHKIALPTSNGYAFVRISEILYCESSSNYTLIYLNDGKKYTVTRTLKEYEEMLKSHHFFRIHNSYLINMEAVKQYIRGDGGSVVLTNNVTLDVSKRKKEQFLVQWNK